MHLYSVFALSLLYNITDMNYIKKLELENEELKKNLVATDTEIQNFLIYLTSDKFSGFENNFVNATEVRARLLEIRNQINY